MKFKIMHESTGRMRVQMLPKQMTIAQADVLEAYLQGLKGVRQAAVHERTGCAVIRYQGERADLLQSISRFSYRGAEALAPAHSARALNQANPDFRPALKKAGFLTRDPRMKERRKYGLKKARKAPQFSKR